MKRKMFGLMAIVGVFVAICTPDNVKYELAIRGIGLAMFGICSYLGGFMESSNKQNKEEQQ